MATHMLTNSVNFVMIGPVYSEIFGAICCFLSYCHKSYNFYHRNLQDYSTKSHQIFTQCREIIAIAECHMTNEDNLPILPILPLKLVAMATSLEQLQN